MKTVVVTSAIKLTPELKKKIEAVVKQKISGEFELQEEIDPQIIGGLKLSIGGRVYDASIAHKLEELA